MSYRIIRPATREEWLAERKKGIGSSDAGTIMGASPFQTPYGLYLLKTGKAESVKESDAMFNGHILEPAVAEWFASKTGNIIDITSEGDWMAVDSDRDYLRVSPDRLYWVAGTGAENQTSDNARVLEIKSTSKIVDKDDIPDYWYCQIQYQMGILGLKAGALCWITGAPTLHFDYVEVNFNESFFLTLVERIDGFWNDNILKDIPPVEINAEDILKKFPVVSRNTVSAADKLTFGIWKSLKQCRDSIKCLKEQESIIIEELKMATGNADILRYVDKETGEETVLATWKNTSTEVFNQEAFKKDNPDLWEKFILSTVEESFDRVAFKKTEPEIYANYVTKCVGTRKFLVK